MIRFLVLRPGRLFVVLAGLLLAGLPAVAATPSDGLRVVNVGIVYDGPPPGGETIVPERFQELIEMIEQETAALTGLEFHVRFPRDKQLSGEWLNDRIRRAIFWQRNWFRNGFLNSLLSHLIFSLNILILCECRDGKQNTQTNHG